MRGIEYNKEGQQLTLTTIIIIVLGIMVLVFLVWGFSKGWNNLWSKVTTLGGGENNAGTVQTACDLACSSQNKYNYCTLNKTVKFGENVKGVNKDCTALGDATLKESKKTIDTCFANCNNLSKSTAPRIEDIGFSPCPAISCS